jgi:hypothetical protein
MKVKSFLFFPTLAWVYRTGHELSSLMIAAITSNKGDNTSNQKNDPTTSTARLITLHRPSKGDTLYAKAKHGHNCSGVVIRSSKNNSSHI